MDILLDKFFEHDRWVKALNKGSLKGIDRKVLKKYMNPAGREELFAMIISGNYHIERPHTAKIPKDTPGEYRTVFINTDEDRVFLSIVNDMLFELCKDMVSDACVSYQTGIGCAKIVTKASKMIDEGSGSEHKVIGWKSDLSKYFDSVPIEYIDKAFDKVEEKYGKSKIIDIVREYYHNDNYYDSETKQECSKYQSLKQGCAVAAWLADVILYDIDEKLKKLPGYFVRYCDDTIYIGSDYEQAMKTMSDDLSDMNMTLNPKKVEYLTNTKWFKFLGFSIKGKDISLSPNRIKTFTKEISSRTIKKIHHGISYKQALKSVQGWLYRGDGTHSWATSVLKTINVEEDINSLNSFVMDCLRAVIVGKSVGMDDIGGLGWVRENQAVGCIQRGKGKKVKTLKEKTNKNLEGYYSLKCMRKNMFFGKDLFASVIREM